MFKAACMRTASNRKKIFINAQSLSGSVQEIPRKPVDDVDTFVFYGSINPALASFLVVAHTLFFPH